MQTEPNQIHSEPNRSFFSRTEPKLKILFCTSLISSSGATKHRLDPTWKAQVDHRLTWPDHRVTIRPGFSGHVLFFGPLSGRTVVLQKSAVRLVFFAGGHWTPFAQYKCTYLLYKIKLITLPRIASGQNTVTWLTQKEFYSFSIILSTSCRDFHAYLCTQPKLLKAFSLRQIRVGSASGFARITCVSEDQDSCKGNCYVILLFNLYYSCKSVCAVCTFMANHLFFFQLHPPIKSIHNFWVILVIHTVTTNHINSSSVGLG